MSTRESVAEPVKRSKTRQIYIGEDAYEICRRLAFERRSTIREEVDRLVALGLTVDLGIALDAKKGAAK